MKIMIFNYDTKELINTIELKTKEKVNNFFSISRTTLARMQETEDILKIGKNLVVKDWGFDTLFHSGHTANTMDKGLSCSCITGENSFIFGPNSSLEEKAPKNVVLWNPNNENKEEVLDLRVGFVLYEEGWVISTGKTSSNILGITNTAYITSIGTRNIRSSFKSGAKIFKTKKSLLEYLKKHKETFKFCVEKYDYNLSIETTCDYFEQELSKKVVKAKEKEIDVEINSLLEEINYCDDISDGYDDFDLPSEVNETTIREEILYRMKKYDLWDEIVKKYKSENKIYMSESGGIIYDLDETAKEIVEKVIEYACTPFHVIHTFSSIGEFYQVLFVSKDTSQWRYERGRKDGYMYNCCFNKTYDNIEFGESQFISCNGGMQRIG